MHAHDMSSDPALAGEVSGGAVPDFDTMSVVAESAVPFVMQWSADESHRSQLDVALAGVAAVCFAVGSGMVLGMVTTLPSHKCVLS